MTTPVTCPSCGETLDIPNDLLGGQVRCASCRHVFTAPPPADRLPHDVPTDRRADRPPADDSYRVDDYDADPRRRRPKRGGLPAIVWVLLGGFVLGTCACCGGFGYLVARMMNPDLEPYRSPDGRFTTKFPGEAKAGTRPTGRDGESAKSVQASRYIIGPVDETYFVYYVDLTPAERKTPTKVADELAEGLVRASGGQQVGRQSRRGHHGHDAADVSIRLPDGKHTIARVVVADGRGYVIGVTGPGNPGGAPWVDEFLDAFEVTEPGGQENAANPFRKREPAPPAKPKKPADEEG